jgi:hypothetical protein
MNDEKSVRVEHANQLIRIIGSHGRRFFWNEKNQKNETRRWPDWRTSDPEKAIEHDRSHDSA